MKKTRLLLIATLACVDSFIASAQWVQDANGDLSTSKIVTMSGEVRVTTPYAPFSLSTGINGIIDLTKNTGVVGWLGNNHYNFLWGTFNGNNEGKGNPALRIGKVTGTEWYGPGYLSTAIGENVGADGAYALSVGFGTRANGNYSVALGAGVANGQYSASLGKATAGGDYSFATGTATAGGQFSAALNAATTNGGAYSTSLNKSLTDGDYSFATGNSYTLGKYSAALCYSQTLGDYAIAGGYASGAYGTNSIAFGTYVSSLGVNSVTIGSGLANNQQLTNKMDNSLMIGFNSNTLPSVFVGPFDPINKESEFGFVGIGTTTPKYELSVNGTIVAKTAVFVENLPGEWPDYVFNKNYSLMSLREVEKYIEMNHHLPGVSSKEQIKKEGLNLGEMEMIMMQKIEELTLHMIQLEKENESLKGELNKLKNRR